MNALIFLYKRVLNHPLQDSINALRADKKINVPQQGGQGVPSPLDDLGV